MMAAKKLVGFNHELRVVGKLFRIHLEGRIAIAHHVDLKRWRSTFRQLDGAEVRARDYRRINEYSKRNCFEIYWIRRSSTRTSAEVDGRPGQGQGGAVLPSVRQTQMRLIEQIVRRVSFGIKQHLVPT